MTRALITGHRGFVGVPAGSKSLVPGMEFRYTFTIVSYFPEMPVTRGDHHR